MAETKLTDCRHVVIVELVELGVAFGDLVNWYLIEKDKQDLRRASQQVVNSYFMKYIDKCVF